MDEKAHVESPMRDQLGKLGWMVLRLEQKHEAAESFRTHIGQGVLLPSLEQALRKINPFLRNEQVAEGARGITAFPQKDLIENNRQVPRYSLENTTVSVNHDTGAASPSVRFVDFKNCANNSFIAISQFKVKFRVRSIPSCRTSGGVNWRIVRVVSGEGAGPASAELQSIGWVNRRPPFARDH